MHLLKPFTILFMLIIFTVGCAQKPVSTDISENMAHQEKLAELTSWELNARVSIQAQNDAFTATLIWQQRPDEQLVELNGLFAKNYARITVNQDKATLVIEEQQTYEARYAEDLMLRHLGYIIPVTAMTNWLKGSIQGTNSDQWQEDSKGLIRELRDRGWEITYKRYARFPGIKGVLLPSRMTLSNGKEKIKISVKNWSIL